MLPREVRDSDLNASFSPGLYQQNEDIESANHDESKPTLKLRPRNISNAVVIVSKPCFVLLGIPLCSEYTLTTTPIDMHSNIVTTAVNLGHSRRRTRGNVADVECKFCRLIGGWIWVGGRQRIPTATLPRRDVLVVSIFAAGRG